MDALLSDIRYALRSLLKSPGFAAIAILTLALGIGANTAIFSVVYAVMLRPLPYPDPDQLIGLVQRSDRGMNEMAVTYPQYQYLVRYGTDLQGVAASTGVGLSLATGTSAVRVHGLHVSANYFQVLGVAPQLGRTFATEEDQPGGPHVALLGAGLWRQQFAADPSVLNRIVSFDGEPYTVIGVMPDGFDAGSGIEVWTTLAQVGRTIGNGSNLDVIARLKPGMPLAQARTRMGGMLTDFRTMAASRGWPASVTVDIESYRALVSGDATTPVLLLFAAIGFVLLIACANVASLLLGRAAVRSRELAVRVALGATQRRLVRQLLTESLLLSLLGGALGLVLAEWGLEALVAMVRTHLPGSAVIRLDPIALAFTGGLSLATGLAFGLLPAWLTARAGLEQTLKEGARRMSASKGLARLRNVLVVGEVALALVLLTGAGLLIRTMGNLLSVDPGFDVHRTAAAQIWLNGSRYHTTGEVDRFYQDLTTRLRTVPGVEASAVVAAGLPLERGGNTGAKLEGQPDWVGTDLRVVTPTYFETLRIPLVEGRRLAETDVEGSAPVTVVNQAFVRNYLKNQPVIGRMVEVGDAGRREIVGVVGDARSYIGYRSPPTVFVPSGQASVGLTMGFSVWYPINVLIRTSGDPHLALGTLRQIITQSDAQVPAGRVSAMDDVLSSSLEFKRFVMTLLAVFAALAVTLAAVGLYGVIAYLVTQRTHEMGVRLALGARSSDVVRLVMARGAALAAAGTVAGVAGAIGLTRLLSSQLFGVPPLDPVAFAGSIVLLLATALLASYLPARRAAKVDPMVALRHE